MLREALGTTGIDPERAASLLGINADLFQSWVAGQQPIPYSFQGLLSTVLGIDLAKIGRSKEKREEIGDVTPAIWYRFRAPEIVEQDREFVFLIRQLGFFVHELEEATESKLVGWSTVFQEIRKEVDKQAPPGVQGRQAAQLLRNILGLSSGARGIGEVFRGSLRSIGIVVIETPLTESKLEGCCFLIGDKASERPCIFANSHGSTWFRRNAILAHELAHAIFDADAAGAALDFVGMAHQDEICELRADAFAQAMLVPTRVVGHVSSSLGVHWDNLGVGELARLVAILQVEKRMVLKAALEAGLISDAQRDEYLKIDIRQQLPQISDHALSTQEYIKKFGEENIDWLDKRDTTIPSRRLRLPPLYVAKVIDAYKSYQISRSKAAEFLMIGEDVLDERFPMDLDDL